MEGKSWLIIVFTGPLIGGSLEHFGIKGQKWGERRYQNEDGTLTDEGKIRYARSIKDAKQYRTAKDRLKTIGKAGRIGASIGVGLMGASGGRSLIREMRTGMRSFTRVPSDRVEQVTVGLIAAGAIGGMAVSALQQGAQAAKVKRGQDFIAKYQAAYEKTYGGQA